MHAQTLPVIDVQPEVSDQAVRVREIIDFLVELGLPPIPVAPTQDSYGQHKELTGVTGDLVKTWAHCPLTKNFKPEALSI